MNTIENETVVVTVPDVETIAPVATLAHFTVDRKAFAAELAVVVRAVEKRSTIPILLNVMLESADDSVRMTCTDLEIGLVASCSAVVESEGSITVPAKTLLDAIKRLPGDRVTMQASAAHALKLTAGRTTTKLFGMSRDSYPELPNESDITAFLPARQLNDAIGRIDYAISKEESRFTLNGALMVLADGTFTMCATDGHRLAFTSWELPALPPPVRVLIPTAALIELERLTAKENADVRFSQDENHVFFGIGDRLLLARKLKGSFPDYDRVMPKEYGHTAIMSKADLKAAVERALPMADERSHALRFTLSAGQLTVFASTCGDGEYSETLSVGYSGTDACLDGTMPFVVGYNGKYILDIIAATAESELVLMLKSELVEVVDAKDDSVTVIDKGPQSAGEIRPLGNSEVRHIIMPMRT